MPFHPLSDTLTAIREPVAPAEACGPATVLNFPRSAIDLAVLVHDFRASGVVINAIRIAEAAQSAGLRAEVWVHDTYGPMSERMPDSIAVRRFGSTIPRLSRTARSVLAVPFLTAELRRRRPAVLLSAGNHVHAFAVIAHRLAGQRWTTLVGRVSNALAATVEPKRPGWRGRILQSLAVHVERWQYRAMDELIAVSRELAIDLSERAGVHRPVTLIPNGIDAAAIGVKANDPLDHIWFAAGQAPVIAAMGRLSRQKNFAQLLRAFALVRKIRRVRLAIIGTGCAAEKDALLRLCEELDITRDVWFAGHQQNPYRILSRASLFVSTSRWEGASNVLLEALALGLPIVATRCPAGVQELLESNDAAQLVRIDDVAETAEAMAAMLDRGRCERTALETAADYALDETLSRYACLLAQALKAQRRALDI